jgi:hypothetical protein
VKAYFAAFFWVLVVFNFWHATKRGIWHPVSVINSLHLTRRMADLYRPFDPSLRESTFQYDGQYVYAMTYDPYLRHVPPPTDLLTAYRYQRILLPLLAHLASFGKARAYPYVLLLINILAYAGGGVVVWKLIQLNRWTSWLLLGYLVNTGLLYSTFGTLTETLGFALSLFGILLWQKDNLKWGAFCFMASALSRETYLIIPLSVLSYEVVASKRPLAETTGWIVVIATPFLLWSHYVHLRLPGQNTFILPPEAPPSFGIGRFTLPFVGVWKETLYGIEHLTTYTNIKLTASVSAATLFGTLASFVSVFKKVRFWSWMTAVQGLYLMCMRGDLWNFHSNSARAVIPLFFFLMAWCADEMKYEI